MFGNTFDELCFNCFGGGVKVQGVEKFVLDEAKRNKVQVEGLPKHLISIVQVRVQKNKFKFVRNGLTCESFRWVRKRQFNMIKGKYFKFPNKFLAN